MRELDCRSRPLENTAFKRVKVGPNNYVRTHQHRLPTSGDDDMDIIDTRNQRRCVDAHPRC